MPVLLRLLASRPRGWRAALAYGAGGIGALLLLAGVLLALPPPASVRSGGVVSVRVTDHDGTLLRELRPAGRGAPVRLQDVPPFAVQALIATEDRRFYQHPGVDVRAVARAALSALRYGRVTSGASTIPMQVARA
ncbi:MAG TPA: transglycosylase domain-containing protein, partial [Rhodothermales bacterium]|nr:transglycosylase domain-containing protein [Rhodothermales bacterium]